jgi:hypothetical protein
LLVGDIREAESTTINQLDEAINAFDGGVAVAGEHSPGDLGTPGRDRLGESLDLQDALAHGAGELEHRGEGTAHIISGRGGASAVRGELEQVADELFDPPGRADPPAAVAEVGQGAQQLVPGGPSTASPAPAAAGSSPCTRDRWPGHGDRSVRR